MSFFDLFSRKSKRERIMEKRIQHARLKLELSKYRSQMKAQKVKQTISKYDRLKEDIAGLEELKGYIAENYNKGEFAQILENPVVGMAIRAFIQKHTGQDIDISGLNGLSITEREKRIHEILQKLPPEALAQAATLLGKK